MKRNDEIRMPKPSLALTGNRHRASHDCLRSENAGAPHLANTPLPFRHSVIRHSNLIRHSCFVIRHFPLVIRISWEARP
jgi:hypothetical protein